MNFFLFLCKCTFVSLTHEKTTTVQSILTERNYKVFDESFNSNKKKSLQLFVLFHALLREYTISSFNDKDHKCANKNSREGGGWGE